MSGSGVPPQGFRWVEPADGAPPPGPPHNRRRWWIVAVTVVVVALVAGGVLWWQSSGSHGDRNSAHSVPKEAPIGTPKDRLFRYPLTRQPVPSWQLSTADIGLPPGVPIGDLFAAVGENAYFVAFDCHPTDGCGHHVGAVYGVNTTTGAVLFTIPMDGFRAIADSCFLNGPSTAICVTPTNRIPSQHNVWVFDLERGALSYTSDAPQVFGYGAGPLLHPIGNIRGETRLIATVKDKGIYGVGPNAELTWFLPGTGQLLEADHLGVSDIDPVTLSIQVSSDSQRHQVFSVDGKDLTPTPPQGATLDTAQVYAGGYMYRYNKGHDTGILLYNTDGILIADIPHATRPQPNPAMPTFLNGGTQIYTADGKHLSTLAGGGFYYRTIATTVFTGGTSGYGPWEAFDILTGQPGPTCDMDLGGYIGSDGNTIIWRHEDWDTDVHAFIATDKTTCQTLWEIPSQDSTLQKAGTTLIQTTMDTLTGLQAPT